MRKRKSVYRQLKETRMEFPTEPALKALNVESLMNLAIKCLRKVRAKGYEGLAYYEKDAAEISLHFLARLECGKPKEDGFTQPKGNRNPK